MLQIVQVVLQSDQHLLHRVRITVIERGITCHTRTNLIEHIITGILLFYQFDVIGTFRTWSYKCHVADKHIPQLGQFIEMMLAEETPNLGLTGIIVPVAALEQRRTPLLCPYLHRTELIDGKGSAEASDALLLEDGRSTVLPSHSDKTECEQRRKENQGNQCQQTVHDPFRVPLKHIHPVGNIPYL